MSENLQQEFKLKFGGEPNSIDAETLGYSLVNITSIISEINQQIEPSQPIDIKVKAHGEGSFIVHLALLPSELGQLLTPDNLKLAGAGVGVIITVLAGVLKLRKLLKGRPPKEITQGDHGIVVIGDNARIEVDKATYEAYFGSQKISEALSKTFKTLDGDPEVTGLELLDYRDEALFDATRSDFSGMALKGDLPLPETRSIVQEAHLYIVKPCFERGLKWEMVFNGIRVPVSMDDENFWNQIDRGERFAKGDALAAQLEIEQVLDPNLNIYLNRGYRIVGVNEHIPRSVQPRLDFGRDYSN